MKSQLIETPNGKIEITSIGKGTAILFVHGGHGNSQETLFHKGFDTERFQLITPSRPGYGLTPLSTNQSPRKTADLFVSLLDDLKINSAIVVGISAGGLTAIELAANYPSRVAKLIFISAVTHKWLATDDALYKKGKRIFKPSIEKYSWAMFRFFYSIFPKLMAKVMFKELSTVEHFELGSKEISELQSMINKQRSYTGFDNDLDQAIEPATISRIVCSTLILHSTNDHVVNIGHAHHAKQAIKNSILHTYNNRWGHLLWLGEESAAPIAETLTFIES
jgi:pimeloyl-ACP methyl ester carboxylesterase